MLPHRFGARVLTTLLVSVLVFLMAIPAPRAQEGRPLGQIGRVVGEVSVVRGSDSLPAASGTVLHEGDAIATGPGGRVEVLVNDGSTITLGADTTVSLASFAVPDAGPGRAFLEVIEGILRIALSGTRPWQGFEVRSATAVASVRSTDWIVDASRVKTGVFVVDGNVAVTSRDGAGEVTLAPGQGTDVVVAALPSAPKAWGQKRVDDALARTQMP